MQKEELLRQSLDVYKNLSTYREIAFRSGRNLKLKNFDINIEFKIQTWFARPCYLRIECELVSTVGGGERHSELLCSFTSNESSALEIVNDVRMPIDNPLSEKIFIPFNSSPLSVQRSIYSSAEEGLRTSPMIRMFAPLAGLLINPGNHFLSTQRGVVQFPDQQILHAKCHQLVVYHGKPLTNDKIWIDQMSHLVLRVVTPFSPLEVFPFNLVEDLLGSRGIGLLDADSKRLFPLSEDYTVHYYEIDPELNISMFRDTQP